MPTELEYLAVLDTVRSDIEDAGTCLRRSFALQVRLQSQSQPKPSSQSTPAIERASEVRAALSATVHKATPLFSVLQEF